MELDDIKQYSHKMKKIHITNQNKASQYTTVTIKITLDDVKDNEIIRFSANEYSDWFVHQSVDNDFFLEIPNKKETVITIYAHYFPSALYDYLEEQQIFSIYDWNELVEDMPISQYHNESYSISEDEDTFIDDNRYLDSNNILHVDGKEYTIDNNGTVVNGITYYIRNNKLILNGYTYNKAINKEGYKHVIEDGKLVVRSLLEGSINKYKDPNYKNYTQLIDDNTVSNSTEPGYFPLSSRYRGNKYNIAPKINKNPLAYWKNSTESFVANCNRAQAPPYWEAKIHKNGLSPLIAEYQNGQYVPINVFLNYQYLPTSTEYHQHYFGFEPKNTSSDDGRWENTPNNIFTVLDGENLTTINKQFGQESTYRIINQGNPFDDSHEMTIEHDKVIPINLNDGVPSRDENGDYTCYWDYNKCYKYYVYTPNGEGHVTIGLELEEDEPYKLQYFMYIPSESIVEDDSCTVRVEHRDADNNIYAIDELSEDIKDILLQQDKVLRDQWIYHEIDFKAESNNRIVIKGPQHKKESKTVTPVNGRTYNKQEHETISDDKVYFVNFRLIKMGEYSPTLKYNETGLFLVEKDKYTLKSTSEQYNDCVSTETKDNFLPLWENKNNLPTPVTDVYFTFDDDFDILYDEITSELSWTADIEDCVFSFLPYNEYADADIHNGELSWETDDDEISLIYNSIEDNISNGELSLYRRQTKTFTTGANNSFTLMLQDSNGLKVTDGKVQCDIVKTVADLPKNSFSSWWQYPTIMSLGTVEPNQNGEVSFRNLNFKKLKPSDDEVTYFLRAIYTHPCIDKSIVDFKPLLFEKEHRNMTAYMYLNDTPVFCASSSYQDYHYQLNETDASTRQISSVEQLPIRIDTYIHNQLGNEVTEGYCELSINDKVVQSTIVDITGTADFYIDFDDIYGNEKPSNNYNYIDYQVIKIEYFNKYYESINFLYFDMVFDIESGYDTRPAVPIRLCTISDNNITALNTPVYQMTDNEEVFMLNIDTADFNNISITIQKDNGDTQTQNVTNSNDFLIFTDTYNNKTEEHYTIITDNLNVNDPNGKYRRNKKTFTVVWNR